MEPLATALAEVRTLLLGNGLLRAVAAGRRKGAQPAVPRVELRAVTVSADAGSSSPSGTSAPP